MVRSSRAEVVAARDEVVGERVEQLGIRSAACRRLFGSSASKLVRRLDDAEAEHLLPEIVHRRACELRLAVSMRPYASRHGSPRPRRLAGDDERRRHEVGLPSAGLRGDLLPAVVFR